MYENTNWSSSKIIKFVDYCKSLPVDNMEIEKRGKGIIRLGAGGFKYRSQGSEN